jgi:hypothetical protein
MKDEEFEKYFRKFEEVYERDGFGCLLPTNERKIQMRKIFEEVYNQGARDAINKEAYEDAVAEERDTRR